MPMASPAATTATTHFKAPCAVSGALGTNNGSAATNEQWLPRKMVFDVNFVKPLFVNEVNHFCEFNEQKYYIT